MQIGDRIARRRKELGMTQDELAIRVGYKSKAAISKIETNVNDITQSMVVKFADALDTTVAYLMGWDSSDAPAGDIDVFPELPSEEHRLLSLWRKADEIDQSTIWNILRRYEEPGDDKKVIYIRHYLVPAAAGYASAIEGEDYELIELPADAPRGADFCISISGDSMEPYIHDGEMVYVKRGAELKDFEPGIFFVDGNVYCKQYCPGYAGEFYLLSANPMREDANIIVRKDDGKTCFYFGKVLLKMRLPAPRYY